MNTETLPETASNPPAGWYVPQEEDAYRWWDGVQWTQHTAPTVLPPAPQTATQRRKVRNSWFALVCAPLGLIYFMTLDTINPSLAWMTLVYALALFFAVPFHIVRVVRNRRDRGL